MRVLYPTLGSDEVQRLSSLFFHVLLFYASLDASARKHCILCYFVRHHVIDVYVPALRRHLSHRVGGGDVHARGHAGPLGMARNQGMGDESPSEDIVERIFGYVVSRGLR